MPKRKNTSKKITSPARSGISISSSPPLGAIAGIALIVIIAFLAYFPALSGGFIWDDNMLLAECKLVKDSDGLYRFWCTTEAQDYWPMTNTTFWLEWRLWGMNTTGYHVSNLILHIIESLLIWVILRKLSVPGAFLAAVIFTVHPVNVESVAWIAQRKNLMAMLFFLLSILTYLKMEIPSALYQSISCTMCADSAHGVCGILSYWYWLSLSAFVLAMLSKGSVTVLPVLLLGIIWWLRPLTHWDLLRIAPFFLVAVVLAGVNVWFQTHGTGEEIRLATFAQRLLGAAGVVWFYLYKSLFPIDLAFVYPQWRINAGNPLWWLPLLAALFVTAALWRYKKTWGRPFLFAWGFFCVALGPVLGFMDVYFMKYSLVADHYQHIALIGVIALVAAGLSLWYRTMLSGPRRAAVAVAIVALGTLTIMTWRQSMLYCDDITVYQATLAKNPECWMAHINLGKALSDKGRTDEEIKHYEQALALNPDNAEALNNLGCELVNAGRLGEGIDLLEHALRVRPNDHEVHTNLGVALFKAGRIQDAIEHHKQSINLKPKYYDAYYNLGSALLDIGRLQEAIENYEHALLLKPDSYAALNNLGISLVKIGRSQEAIKYFQQALALKPDFADIYYNLGMTYVSMNQPSQAIPMVQKALELARSQRKTVQAKNIEDWLNSHQARTTDGAPLGRDGQGNIENSGRRIGEGGHAKDGK